MNILIAGGTGFISQLLIHHWQNGGQQHQISVLGRSIAKIQQRYTTAVNAYTWQQLQDNLLSLDQFDVIINLCGAGIADKRWSIKRKQQLYHSRLQPAQQLCAALLKCNNPPRLLSASGVGIYGLHPNQACGLADAVDEYSAIAAVQHTFISQLASAWEHVYQQQANADVMQMAYLRCGVVLDSRGGALAKMYWPYKFCLGGLLGKGHQPMSWISGHDLCRAVDFIIATPKLKGAINLVSPHCTTQGEFARSLAESLKRPCIVTTPAYLLKKILGDMAAELLLAGQHVVPTKLLEAGFQFEQADIQTALTETYRAYYTVSPTS